MSKITHKKAVGKVTSFQVESRHLSRDQEVFDVEFEVNSEIKIRLCFQKYSGEGSILGLFNLNSEIECDVSILKMGDA